MAPNAASGCGTRARRAGGAAHASRRVVGVEDEEGSALRADARRRWFLSGGAVGVNAGRLARGRPAGGGSRRGGRFRRGEAPDDAAAARRRSVAGSRRRSAAVTGRVCAVTRSNFQLPDFSERISTEAATGGSSSLHGRLRRHRCRAARSGNRTRRRGARAEQLGKPAANGGRAPRNLGRSRSRRSSHHGARGGGEVRRLLQRGPLRRGAGAAAKVGSCCRARRSSGS